jgi:hypothetical protein
MQFPMEFIEKLGKQAAEAIVKKREDEFQRIIGFLREQGKAAGEPMPEDMEPFLRLIFDAAWTLSMTATMEFVMEAVKTASNVTKGTAKAAC